jgi:hypothetical protein
MKNVRIFTFLFSFFSLHFSLFSFLLNNLPIPSIILSMLNVALSAHKNDLNTPPVVFYQTDSLLNLSGTSQEISWPFRIVSGPLREFSESSREFSGPSREFSGPFRAVSGPFRAVSGPLRAVSEPFRAVSEPLKGFSGTSKKVSWQ